jgi:lantibiotic leader peptide-processing serine protease
VRSHRTLTAIAAAATALIVTITTAPTAAGAAGTSQTGATTEYTVLAGDNVSVARATAAITAAGGTVVDHNDAVGLFRVVAPVAGFAERASATPTLVGAARRTPIGQAPTTRPSAIEHEGSGPGTAGSAPKADPLDSRQWDMRMINADRAHAVSGGSRKVSVGVLDTGLDASNPDLAPNFSRSLSRNFAPDIPEIDGPCEVAGCLDPVGTDDNGHGTHVAGTIAAAANGVGITGIAPDTTLVELKGGQDSGFFFLEPVVNALTYAATAGVDVINMSFYLDPWLFNCAANPADSPAAQAEQRTIVAAMSRALTFAHRKGVTLISALGNEHEDLGSPLPDSSSPDYPAGSAYTRTIDNATCLSMPTEGPFVIGVSSLGPSGRKSDFSNYGTEQISVSAPGGWFRDGYGTPSYRTPDNEILSTYPEKVLQEEGAVDADGNVVAGYESSVFKSCTKDGRCGYYTYLQGTSMAAPHAVGVAALIVSRFGREDPEHRGTLRLDPNTVESVLLRTATGHACPVPALQTYTDEGRPAEFNALCVGDTRFNGFYGHGIVNAYAALVS